MIISTFFYKGHACVHAKSLELCLTLCDPVDSSPPGSSVHGTLQARVPECHALLQGIFPTQRSNLRLLCILHWHVNSLPLAPPGKLFTKRSEVKWSEVAQSCPTLCDPMDCSLRGSSVHGIFQARILEWVAISFSKRSSRPRDQTQVSWLQADALPSKPPGKW